MKKISIAICLFLMLSCSVSRNETVDDDMEVNRLIRYEDALKGDMKYSTLFDSLLIVPLDTTGGYMIGEVRQMKISAHYIAVLDRNSNVFVYNHRGEGTALISRRGQGEKEYIDVRSIDGLFGIFRKTCGEPTSVGGNGHFCSGSRESDCRILSF